MGHRQCGGCIYIIDPSKSLHIQSITIGKEFAFPLRELARRQKASKYSYYASESFITDEAISKHAHTYICSLQTMKREREREGFWPTKDNVK